MATYFHGNTEIQGNGDGLQTLILMNPAYVGYSDTQPQLPPNFAFLNSNSTATAAALSHPPPSQIQHFAAASAASALLQDSQQHQDFSEPHAESFQRVQSNLYNPLISIGAAREVTRANQGLSLSLSSMQPTGFGSFRPEMEGPSQPPSTSEDIRVSGLSSATGISHSGNGVQSVLLSSKYLKAAQELLDEVVNVGKEGKNIATVSAKDDNGQPKNIGESSEAAAGDGESGGGDGVGKRGAELTTAEKQEIQMKKAKLVNMLDEVEQRYKQYHHQMQMVVSLFERVAGTASAKTYTALALQTISKQFRCLKDAILSQIRVASKNLGEEESLEGKTEGSSRLKYVDNQIRQQRALQQLGMIQHSAWRPQRGLPERSVSVLRAWLFEHFLHPYPKDSDKVMLAKQTGLTRSQVSNWFINARVRLWKPMVEEMYAEEMKEHEGNGSEDKTGKSRKTEQNEVSTSKSTASQAKSPVTEIQDKSFISKLDNLVDQSIASVTSVPTSSTSPTETTMRNNVGFNLIGSSEMESITQGSPKKPRNSNILHSQRSIASMDMESKPTNMENEHMLMKFGNEGQSRDGFTLTGAPTNFVGGFGSYPIVELGRFGPEQFQAPYSGNGVSLTLGLPHCDNISMSGAHQTFLPNPSIQLGRGVEIGEANGFNGMNTSTSTRSTGAYENADIQNRKRFAAQLLPDFVT